MKFYRKSIVIGELTFDEEDTLNKVIYRGLGIGVHNTGDEPQLPSNEKLITIKEEEIEDVPAISFKKLKEKFNLKGLSIKCNHAEVSQYLESKNHSA